MLDTIDRPQKEPTKQYGRTSGRLLLVEIVLMVGLFITMYVNSNRGSNAWLDLSLTFVFLLIVVVPPMGLVQAWKGLRTNKTSRVSTIVFGVSHLLLLFGIILLVAVLVSRDSLIF